MADGRGKVRVKRPKKNVVMFVLSLIIGVVGVYYSKHYIEEQIAFYKGQLEKSEPMVNVVVPVRALARGEIVLKDHLSLMEIPERYADSNAVNDSNFDVAIGQRVSYDIDEGRPLLWAHLEGGISPTFSGKVPDGLRAMTVRVDEVNSISGFLQPKDRVDLLLTHDKGEEQEIVPLIERLEVIATGVQTLVDKNATDGKRTFSTITVQVTPRQAKEVTLAQDVGKLTAMLRNPEDDSPLLNEAMNVSDLLGLEKPLPELAVVAQKPKIKRKAAPLPPGIEYIIGGS